MPIGGGAISIGALGGIMVSGSPKSTYSDKVVRLFGDYLIGYWRMSEATGLTADNYEGTAARDGTYDGVTLGQPGIGDGLTCPLFDGSNDVVDIYSASLAAAWAQGDSAVMIWCKVYNAAVWEDDTARWAYILRADVENRTAYQRNTTDNNTFARVEGNDEVEYLDSNGMSTVDWFNILVTVDEGNTNAELFLDGVSKESGVHTGPWAGPIAETLACIGGSDNGATDPWHGYLAHMAIGCGSGCSAAIQAVRLELATV